jgi:hypothetical protein
MDYEGMAGSPFTIEIPSEKLFISSEDIDEI